MFKRLAWDLPYYKYTLNIHLTIKHIFAWGFGKAVHVTCAQQNHPSDGPLTQPLNLAGTSAR